MVSWVISATENRIQYEVNRSHMLIAAIGALTVITILTVSLILIFCVELVWPSTFAPRTYPKRILHTPHRLMIVLLFLALFYVCFGRRVITLPPIIMHFLQDAPAPLWSASNWFVLATICTCVGLFFSLLNEQWRIAMLSPHFARSTATMRWSVWLKGLLSINRQGATGSTLLPRHAEPLLETNYAATYRNQSFLGFPWRSGQFRPAWRFATSASLVLVVTLVGWLILSRLDLFGGLNGNYSITTLLPQVRATPTPTSNAVSPTLAIVVRDNSTTENPNNNSASALPIATSQTGNTIQAQEINRTIAPDGIVAAEIVPPATLPPAATPLPTPTATPVAYVLVRNTAGVNARAAPNLDAEVLEILLPGSSAPILTEQKQEDWIQIQIAAGVEAWVADYVVELSRPLGNE